MIQDSSLSGLNIYQGGAYQQATSVVTATSACISRPCRMWRNWTQVKLRTEQTAYELNGGEFSTYGFQYKPGFGDAVSLHEPCRARSLRSSYRWQYLAWITDGKLAWTMTQAGVGPDPISNISERPVPQEPMVHTSVYASQSIRALTVLDPRST